MDSLSEHNLLEKYQQSKAVQLKLNKTKVILRSARIKASTTKRLLDKLLPLLIPSGVKAKIKGDAFNYIVQHELEHIFNKLQMDKQRYKLDFECLSKHLTERADWMLYDNNTKRTIIGYNQIDLWSGGHQINRSGKYILDECLHKRLKTKKIKLVCIVGNPTPRNVKPTSKLCRILQIGQHKQRMLHLSDIRSLLEDFIGSN